MKEFQEVMDDICVRYPQIELYLKSKGMRGIADLLTQAEQNGSNNKSIKELDIEELKSALSQVDSQVKFLPATGQVPSSFLTNLLKVKQINLSTTQVTSSFCSLRSLRNKGHTLQNALIVWKNARENQKVP